MSSHHHVTRAAGVVGVSTLATRVLGYVRDMVIALTLGTGMAADAFFVAFRIPNTLRRLVGEGALTIAFIPVFVEEQQKSEKHAWALTHAVMTLLMLLLSVITSTGIIFAPLLLHLIAPGFQKIPEKFELAIFLTRLTFPYIFFISLTALAMGVLNSLRHFLAPALAPAMLNISLISCALFVCPRLEPPVTGLAIGVILGGMFQLAFQIPALLKRGFQFRLRFDSKNPAVRKVGRLLLPALFGLAVHQITVFVNTLLASFLPEGSVSYLYYAYRLIEFPLGIFGMAVATAVLPTMSSQSAQGDYEQLIDTLSFALRLVLFITIPSMVGMIVLRVPIITLLLQRGNFTKASTMPTADALFYYTLGLAAIACVRIVVPVFYSLKDTATPVKCGAAAVAINILLSLLLMKPLLHNGLALATSISAFFNLFLLLWILRQRLGTMNWRSIGRSLTKVGIASTLMGLGCAPCAGYATKFPVLLFGVIFLGVGIFGLCAWRLQSRELTFLQEMLLSRLKRKMSRTS